MSEDFPRVLDSYGPPLWRLTAAYTRTPQDREDLYQEILIALWRAWPSFRGEASVRTFVYRIGHNRGLTFRARSDRRARLHDDIPAELADGAPGPDHALDRDAERERLLAAIAKLSPTLAQPVTRHLEGLSHAAIGDVLGITTNNVAVRMNRARAELGRLLSSPAEVAP